MVKIVKTHGLLPHLYADDIQIYGSCAPANTQLLEQCMSSCIDEVALWMKSNRLQLNAAKTEIIWCGSARRQHQVPTTTFKIGVDDIAPARSVRDLGVYLDDVINTNLECSRWDLMLPSRLVLMTSLQLGHQ